MADAESVPGRSRRHDGPEDLFATGHTEPILSSQLAIFCSLLYTVLYIAPFYLSATLRHTPLNSRDDPTCIRARVRAVGWTCLACTATTTTLLYLTNAASDLPTLLRLLGIYPISITDILRVLLLTATLFTCSLYELLIVDSAWRNLSLSNLKAALWTSPRGFRNLVIAPLSEELVFRALSLPLYLLAGVSATKMIFLSPLVFGVAHAHHLVEFLQTFTPEGKVWWRDPPRGVLVSGLVRTVFQFAYTSLFGFFAAFVWLRMGSFWGCVVVHGFCNFMGLPRVWGRVGNGNDEEEEEDDGDQADGPGKEDGGTEKKGQQSIAWTVVYYVLVPLGMYGFHHWLWVLTESENALVRF